MENPELLKIERRYSFSATGDLIMHIYGNEGIFGKCDRDKVEEIFESVLTVRLFLN